MPDSAPSDTDLLDDWLRHHRESAFHALVRRYQALVHAVAIRRCGDDSIAAEATQLTFISLAQKAQSLRSRSTLVGWLHLTSVFHTRNLVRRHQRETRRRQLLRTHMDTHLPAPVSETWSQMQPVIDEALAALSSQDRETLLLRFYRALTVKEIASVQGIATDAAQKRLDRATERIRLQLTRRGCTIGGSLATVLLAGFSSGAQAALPSSAAIASMAIAAASATTSLTTLGIITMTKKATITAAAALLLVGVSAVAIVNRDASARQIGITDSASSPSSNATPGGSSVTDSGRAVRPKPRDLSENPELVSKYGESRTNLCKHVTADFISVMEDGTTICEMMISTLSKQPERQVSALQGALKSLGNDLKLTDNQKEKAGALYIDFLKRELEKSKTSLEDLKKDPTPMMKKLLADDAFSREKISVDEYKQVQSTVEMELDGMKNTLGLIKVSEVELMKDATFSRGLQALLDPVQTKIYQVANEQKKLEEQTRTEDGVEVIDTINLEEFGNGMTEAKQMFTGLKQKAEAGASP